MPPLCTLGHQMSEGSKKLAIRAREGAVARWDGDGRVVRFSIDEGVVSFADMEFKCAVLDDESRVINGTEFMRVMGVYRSGALSTRRSEDDQIHFPLHLAFKNLRPYILEDTELVDALREPIRYRSVKGSVAEGFPGQVLRRICSVWARALHDGVLGASQSRVAAKAQVLLDALADVAIIALIDEATGYQKRRAHDELQRISQSIYCTRTYALEPAVSVVFLRTNISSYGLAVRCVFN